MNPSSPEQEPKRRLLSKAFELAIDAATSDGYSNTSSEISELDAGALRVKQWDRFARKNGLAYRRELRTEEIIRDQRLSTNFEEFQRFGYPLSGVAGLLEGTWRGCELFGFHTYSASESGDIAPYRFV